MRKLTILLAALLALPLSACGAESPVLRQTAAHTVHSPERAVTNRVTKTLVFVVENHSLAEMRSGMPWVYRLARRYGRTTNYHAITHPSLPNYLSIAAGSTFGVRDDASPSAHHLSGPNVFARALIKGRTAKLYAESMPRSCALNPSGRYAVKHNAWPYFTASRGACRRHDVPLKSYRANAAHGRLPNVGMVIPNLCSDAHDCSLATANGWLKKEVGAALAGPDFASGRLAIVITADEDDYSAGNKVLTVVAQRSLRHKVVRARLNHYGLSRSLTQVVHTKALHRAASARSVLHAFGLRTG